MLIGITRREQLQAVREVTTLPLIMGSYEPDVADEDFLRANGVRVVVRGHQPFFVAMKALHDAMKHLVEGGAPEDLRDSVASADLQNAVLDDADSYQTWEREFLGRGALGLDLRRFHHRQHPAGVCNHHLVDLLLSDAQVSQVGQELLQDKGVAGPAVGMQVHLHAHVLGE